MNKTLANSSSPEFFEYPTDTVSLCFEDHRIAMIIVYPGFIDCFNNPYFISGEIKTPGGGGISDVVVHFEGPQLNYPPALTDNGGHYELLVIEPEFMLTITPERNTSHKQGVSTLDLVRLQRHLLGAAVFSSPYQYISADANNSQTVSAIDLVEFRKLILGIYTELPNNKSWRFVREDYDFDDVTNPWPNPATITITQDSASPNFNFVGVKVGDVNSSAPLTSDDPIEIRNSKPHMFWIADQQSYQKGDEVEIKIRTNSLIDLQGFQLTISSSDLLFTNASSASLQLDESTYSNFGERLTISWFDEYGVDLINGDVVFTLKAIATQNGNLKTGLSINSEITEAEVYSMQDEIFTPQLLIHDDSEVNTHTLMPNPWKEQTTIAIDLKEDGITEIEILDLNGRPIYSETKYLLKGNNEIVLESKNFTARGLLMYTVKTEREILSGKMVVLE